MRTFAKLIIFAGIWFVLITLLHRGNTYERFITAWNDKLPYQNEGDQPWERYDVHNSIHDDPVIKYKNAFYYELSNADYENALKNTFKNEKCDVIQQALVKDAWRGPLQVNKGDTNSNIEKTYQQWMVAFEKELNGSSFLRLPNDINTHIQIVHDRLIDMYVSKNNPTRIRIDMEAILYRNSKPHGKHVLLSVVTDVCEVNKACTNQSFNVVAVKLLGIVPEEQIAMYPVLANNPFDEVEMQYLENPSSFANSIVPDADNVINTLNRHIATYIRSAQSDEKTMNEGLNRNM